MTPNSFGTHNNVITVRESDFEAFEALGMDSIQTGHHADNYYVKYGTLGNNNNTHTHTHTRLTALCPGLPG